MAMNIHAEPGSNGYEDHHPVPSMTRESLGKYARFTALLAVPFVLLYYGLYFLLIATSPLTREEMDRNGDGRVSFAEADYAGNVESLAVTVDGRDCLPALF